MRNCLQFNLNCLFYTGFWPKWEVRTRKKTVFYFCRLAFPKIQVCRTIYGIFAQAYNIYLDWGFVSYMAEYFIILAIEIKAMLCMYILIARRRDIESLVHGIGLMQDYKDGEEGKCKILKRTNWIAQFLSILATVIVGATCVGVAVVLAVYGWEHRVVPFRKWFLIDVSSSPFFEVTLFTVMTTQTTDMLVILIFDMLFIAIIIQFIGQYHLINYKLEHTADLVTREISTQHILARLKTKRRQTLRAQLTKVQEVNVHSEKHVKHFVDVAKKGKPDKKQITMAESVNKQRFKHVGKVEKEEKESCLPLFSFGEKDFETSRFLQECVTHHLALIKLFHGFSSLLEPHLVFQLISNCLISVGALYVTTLAIAVDLKVSVMCAILFGSTVEFFAHCVLGTLLVEFSCDLGHSLYCSDWTGLSGKAKRSMQIIVECSRKGVVFKAMSVFPMTLDVFQKVGKFSYSLYAVMDQISTGKKVVH